MYGVYDGKTRLEGNLSFQQAREMLWDMREYYEGESYSCTWVGYTLVCIPPVFSLYRNADPECMTAGGGTDDKTIRVSIRKEG